ncbi:diguanylate cyclase [Aliiroseovarius subalbicans]|uniref:diguanylate cyclase n=1 Tax=Aliiroseovarius subalbicans TaxID=2925840 RepID=UPI001F55ACBC|nr:diguanylate cyclase [Aliiroseovarius subalbicans]
MAGRILIADDVATNRIILKVKLSAARYNVLQARDGAEAQAMARAERPDLIMLGQNIPDGGGAKVCAALKADPAIAAIPIVVVASSDNRAARLNALEAGAEDVLVKPLDEAAFLALVRNLIRTRATHDELDRRDGTARELGFAEPRQSFQRQARLALVGPDPQEAISWRAGLGRMLSERVHLLSVDEVLSHMEPDEAPDAFVIAASIETRGDGLRLVSELRSRTATRHAVIIVQARPEDADLVSMALDLGAQSVVTGEFDACEMAVRLRRQVARKMDADALRKSLDKHLSLALQDPLTGVYNRRYAQTYLSRIAAQSAAAELPFALMVLDLDRFKAVNDTHGHMVGDEVLVEVARRLGANVREIDLLARIGGEEFVIAMPETNAAQAARVAERLRRVVGDAPVRSPSKGIDISVTMSIGVAVGGAAGTSVEDLMESADNALYASKSEGRNQVTFVRNANAA